MVLIDEVGVSTTHLFNNPIYASAENSKAEQPNSGSNSGTAIGSGNYEQAPPPQHHTNIMYKGFDNPGSKGILFCFALLS